MLRFAARCLAQRNAVQPTARSISTSVVCEGRQRRYEGRTPYPRAQADQPPRPMDIASKDMMDDMNNVRKRDHKMLSAVKTTDDEINAIYASLMSPQQRRIRDEQSLRHKSHSEVLELRRQRRLAARIAEPGGSSASNNNKSSDRAPAAPAATNQAAAAAADGKHGEADQDGKVMQAVKSRTVSDKTMEQLVYVDTRVVREIEEAREAVIGSVDSSRIDQLERKVRAAVAARAERLEEPDKELAARSPEGQQGLRDAGLSLGEFNYMIFASSLTGNVEDAMRVFGLMREAGIKPSATTFSNLTVAHAKAGDLGTAVSMFKQLEEEGLQPTIYSYGTLIRAYMEFSRVDDAFGVYEMMKERQMWPNLPVYSSLIVLCLKVGDFNRAWGVFEHLRYTVAEPDETSFTIMLHACAERGEVEKAMNLFEEMVANKLSLSDVAFNSLIHACAMRSDYFDECFRLVEQMEAHGFQPDFYTYNTVIYACARKRNLPLAREIFRDLLTRSMDPNQEDLLKIDAITLTNMMWVYAWTSPGIKNCSWKVAKRYEGIAAQALDDVKKAGHSVCTHAQQRSYMEGPSDDTSGVLRQRQLDSREAVNKCFETAERLKANGASRAELSKHYQELLKIVLPDRVPARVNQFASEVVRLMRFYLGTLGGNVTPQLLNSFLAAMINSGGFAGAWRVALGDFEKFGLEKNGWTFLQMIRLCARTRDVPSAWRVWDEFKAWRANVERELKTPGYESLTPGRTEVYQTKAADKESPAVSEACGDEATLNTASQSMLALTEALEFPGNYALPTNVAGGALAVTAADREVARKQVHCDMKVEHAIYIEMMTLLGSNGDFRSAIQLLREEKNGILEHKHNPTMTDVLSLYQNATVAGNKHAALDIRGLCMQKPLHKARRALHRKWGTSFTWELTSPQYKSLSRRFPEEHRRHEAPFKDGEYVYSQERGTSSNI
ncbi:hypothetical protein GGF46_005469 [Coemansia sp. RSA 552]|nr:hypothetical protein GGF46_005469 [Coemansia sp. RSA 552]